MKFSSYAFVLILALLYYPQASKAQSVPEPLRSKLSTTYNLSETKAILVLAHGTSCPVMRQNMRELQALFDEFKTKGVSVLVINGVPQDQSEEKKKVALAEAKDFGLKEPITSDENQEYLRGFGLTTVGELAIVDPKSWTVVFHGGISDRVNYDFARPKPKNEWAKKALTDFLKGKTPKSKAPIFGCAITFN